MAITLATGINATVQNVTLSADLTAKPGDLYRLGDECVQFSGYQGNKQGSHKYVVFLRGRERTTAAAHLAGVSLLGVNDAFVSGASEVAPGPFTSAGGGAVDSVNGDTGVVVLDAADVGAVPTARTITAGTGLTGGGDLTANRTLAPDFGTAAGKVTQGNDPRLSDARTPTGHHVSHEPGGTDVVALAAGSVAVDPTVAGAADVQAALEALEGAAANLPSDDQKAALDESPTPAHFGNPYATVADLGGPTTLQDAIDNGPVVLGQIAQNAGGTGAVSLDADGVWTFAAGVFLVNSAQNVSLFALGGSLTLNGGGLIAGVSLLLAAGRLQVLGLPTADPAVAGDVWVDTAADFVMKVSQG